MGDQPSGSEQLSESILGTKTLMVDTLTGLTRTKDLQKDPVVNNGRPSAARHWHIFSIPLCRVLWTPNNFLDCNL